MEADNPAPANEAKSFWGALFHRWTWRMAWRDSRTQRLRLVIFSLAIVSGIAALTAIHSLKDSVQSGVATQAKALLGSDLQISSRHPFAADELNFITKRARKVSQETSFSSMLYFSRADGARLVQVRAFEGDYPFYGTVKTTPPDAWHRMHTGPGVLVEPALLDQFGARIGDMVKLGALEIPIIGTVDKPAPRGNRFAGFAPEIYLRRADIEVTGLLQTSSLSFHLLHVQTAAGADSDALKKTIQNQFEAQPWRLETPSDRRDTLGNALDNFQQFLGIIAIASLVLGAIGVAGSVHAHITRRIPTIAILRCLGCRGHTAFAIYFVQAGALGLLGTLIGATVGIVLHLSVLTLFRDSLPIAVEAKPQWLTVAKTAVTGFIVCCGFGLVPLLRIRRVPPTATLRVESSVPRRGTWLCTLPVYLVIAAIFVGFNLLNEANWKRSLSMTGGIAAAFAVLSFLARGLVRFTRRIVNPRWPYLLRQGISNIHRPQNQTLLFLLSLGLGTFLLVTILLVRNILNERLSVQHTAESPNIYLVDVQPDQVVDVTALLASLHLPALESAPMVTMRIKAIRGTPIEELAKSDKVPKWIARREFRSTYRDHLNSTENIVAGKWVPTLTNESEPVPVSLEEQIANDMRVSVGDVLELDVQGVPLTAKVTSLRKVDWSRFNLNFFMVFPKGVLEDAPGFHVVTTRTGSDQSSGNLQRELAKKLPNVSVIDLTLILNTVRDILSQISRVISILAGFTILAALPILVGTLLNGRDMRLRESVLLRTLGASRRQVQWILLIEYATLGILAAVTGLILAITANACLAKFVFEASPWPDAFVICGALVASAIIAIAGGLSLSRGVSRHSPLEILRGVS